jgi:hypothetical protein
MVPWNEGDGDTKIKAAQLQSILRKTFSRQPETVFRSLIRSSEQFMEAISSALNEGRRNILDLLDVFRKAEGDAVSYESGQIVEFHRIARGAVHRGVKEKRFRSGEQWEVLRREEGAVIVGKDRVERQLPLDQARKFSVFGRENITLSMGDVSGSPKTSNTEAEVPEQRGTDGGRNR